MKSSSKKAQAQQIFIFIIAILIASMIFLYGYKAIRDFTQRSEEISLVRFQTDIQSAVRMISPDYGSVKRLELAVPSDYSKVCFVDFDKYSPSSPVCIRTVGQEDEYNPIMCDAWESQTQNVFMVPQADIPIKVPNLEVPSDRGYLCTKVINGMITVRLEGKGDRALVSEWRQ